MDVGGIDTTALSESIAREANHVRRRRVERGKRDDASPKPTDRRDDEAPERPTGRTKRRTAQRSGASDSRPELGARPGRRDWQDGGRDSGADSAESGDRGSASAAATRLAKRAKRPVSQLASQIVKALPLFGDGKPLSTREINERRPEYIETILDWAGALDQLITAATADGTPAFIWSSLTEEEAGVIADWLLERARKSATVAGVVRGMMTFRKKLALVMILLTRAKLTRDHFQEHGLQNPIGHVGEVMLNARTDGGATDAPANARPANLLPLS